MVERVADDEVRFAGDDRQDARVGREARLEDERGLGGLEVGQLSLQSFVDGERPGDGAHGPGADAQLTHGPLRGSPQARVVREAQVVVGGEADDLTAIDAADRPLRRAQLAQRAVEVASVQVGQLVGQESQRVVGRAPALLAVRRGAGHRFAGHHRLQSRSTLPDSPERAAAKAAAWSVKAKRWVMAGRMSRPDWSMTLILYQVSYISRP